MTPIAQQEAHIAQQASIGAQTAARPIRVIARASQHISGTSVTNIEGTAKSAVWRNAQVAVKIKAKAEAEVMAKAKVEAEAKATLSAITAIYSLSVDCLRFSMHFFHPIQQCAQQVYYTALPLSPTSSHLYTFYHQSVRDNQPSHVTAFLGAPETWGLLLRTIDIRPKQLTHITTSLQRIVAACEDIVNIYDTVTFILQQTICAPETVTKIQNSSDGSILFFAHSFSITMWDVQTGGLIHSFTTQSEISDIALSTTGDYIACGSSDGSVAFWNIQTKKGRGFGNNQPVVAIHWLSPVKLAVATQSSVYIANTHPVCTSNNLSILGYVWGMVYLGENKFLVGTSQPGGGTDQELCSLEIISYKEPSAHKEQQPLVYFGQLERWKKFWRKQLPVYSGQLMRPIYMGNKISCITLPSGVQLFDIDSNSWSHNPPLLGAAISVAVSLDRNLVVQTKDSIQIFSLDVLKTGKVHNGVHQSQIYPLGKKHIVCLQPNRHLTLLELETLQELHRGDDNSQLKSLLTNQPPSACVSVGCGLVVEFGILAVMRAWQSGVPLPEQTEAADRGALLSGLSPNRTRVVTVYGSPQQELRVKDANDGTILAILSLVDELATGEVYDLTFDSETRFYLKIDGPELHVQVPHDIIASPSERYSHTTTRGEPVILSEPRATPLYSLDANCEWVLDAKSRKVCWMSPGNIRRGNGGHFWAGSSLVMVGDDGIVRKVTFEDPTTKVFTMDA